MKRAILPVFIFFEVIFIAFIFFKILEKQKNVLGVSMNTLKKENYISEDFSLKYFYEPKPNTTETLSPDFTEALGYPKGTVITTRTNSHRFNQLTDFDPEKPENVFRIVTIGDSFTYDKT